MSPPGPPGPPVVPLTDPALMFETLPRFLLSLPGGVFFGLIFFVSLYLAALNASEAEGEPSRRGNLQRARASVAR